VYVIPNADGNATVITKVCYVACIPSNALQADAPADVKMTYNFDIKTAYLTHCHILEHEENDMMGPLNVH